MFHRITLGLVTLLLTATSFAAVPQTTSRSYNARLVHATSPYVAHSLRAAMDTLVKLSEGQELLRRAQITGPIRFESEHSNRFEAYWDGGRRRICVASPERRSLGSVLRSLVFELHNAVTNRELTELTYRARAGLLSADAYVEGVERMEYQNVLRAAKILEEGIQQGVYPKDAYWEVFPTFEDHYKLQQVSGHSLWIAENYNRFPKAYARNQPFQGTVPGLYRLSNRDKDQIIRYLGIKGDLENAEPELQNQCRELVSRELQQYEARGDRHNLFLMRAVFEQELDALRSVA